MFRVRGPYLSFGHCLKMLACFSLGLETPLQRVKIYRIKNTDAEFIEL